MFSKFRAKSVLSLNSVKWQTSKKTNNKEIPPLNSAPNIKQLYRRKEYFRHYQSAAAFHLQTISSSVYTSQPFILENKPTSDVKVSVFHKR